MDRDFDEGDRADAFIEHVSDTREAGGIGSADCAQRISEQRVLFSGMCRLVLGSALATGAHGRTPWSEPSRWAAMPQLL